MRTKWPCYGLWSCYFLCFLLLHVLIHYGENIGTFSCGPLPVQYVVFWSRSRWSQNYLRPGDGAEIIFVFLGMKYTDRLTVTTADLLAELDHNDVRLDGLYDEADIVAALPGEVSRAHQVHSGSAHL